MRSATVAWLLVAVAVASVAETTTDTSLAAELPGRAETLALARAYPDRIRGVEFRHGDWAVRIDDEWFYWAMGRLLPAGERENWQEYAAHRFYSYEPGLPPLREIDAETAARLEARVSDMRVRPPERHAGFLDALYRAADHDETLSRIVNHEFLGFKMQVHRDIVPHLERVEADLLAAGAPEIHAFLEEVRLVGAFSWRMIAGTATRSYHSYGAALDFIPRYYGRKHAYWRWAMDAGVEEWWAVPYERRWMPPLSVVEAFEKHGFVWGGKWLFYDTIHFEYRPEIRILARLDGRNRLQRLRID